MKTTTTLLIAAATVFSLNANANYLDQTADEEYNAIGSAAVQNTVSVSNSTANRLNQVSFLNETADEEYQAIDPSSEQDIASVLNELDNNPPAAGGDSSKQVSYLNETIEDEHKHQ